MLTFKPSKTIKDNLLNSIGQGIMTEIPQKMYFRIGEVSRIVGVPAYVLRYWESEFGAIKPIRSNKQRLYRKHDVELLIYIKKLLHEEGYTISGAQKQVSKHSPRHPSTNPAQLRTKLSHTVERD